MTEHTVQLRAGKDLPILSYGLPYEVAIARHLETTLKAKRPYLLVSGTLARTTDVIERITKRLASDPAKDLAVAGVRRGMRSHTLYADLLEVVADLRATGADSIVVVGGGSLVDGAKASAFALANDADTHEKLDALYHATAVSNLGEAKRPDCGDHAAIHPSTIPYMCITTTLSAGEYSSFGGATNERIHHKQVFQDPSPTAGHRVIAIDPQLSVTTPLDVWLSTGMRAVDHCVETATAKEPVPEATESALRGIRQLVPALLRSKADAGDVEARLLAQLGTSESMKGVTQYGVKLGGSHGIGHQLGPQGVPHAETTCVLLPAVLKYNKSVNGDQQAAVAAALWAEPVVAKVLREQFHLSSETSELGDMIDAIIRALGLPRTLSHYGIGRDRLDSIATNSLTDWMCSTNPVPLVRKEQILEILEECL